MDDVTAGGTTSAERKHKGDDASPPWVGLAITAVLFLGFLLQIVYTLFTPPGLAALGAWNYAIGWVLIVGAALLLRRWRGEPYRE